MLARLAVVAANRLRFDAALDYGLRAVAAGRAAADDAGAGGGPGRAEDRLAYLGDTGALAAVLAELEPLLRRQGDLFRLQWAVFESAFVAVAAADWDRGHAAIGAAIEINRRSGYPH